MGYDSVMLFDINEFMLKIEKVFNSEGIDLVCGKIMYRNNKINHLDVMESFSKSDPKRFFYKDKCFKHQYEYRLVALNKSVYDKKGKRCYIVNIGSIKDISGITDINSLFSGNIVCKIE